MYSKKLSEFDTLYHPLLFGDLSLSYLPLYLLLYPPSVIHL